MLPYEESVHDEEPRSTARSPLTSEAYVANAMPPVLTTWDLTTIFVVSLYFVSYAASAAVQGAAALTQLVVVGVLFLVPSLVATAQLSTLFPYEGGLYNWTYRVLGGYWGFFAGLCSWLPGLLITCSMAGLLIDYIHTLRSDWLNDPLQQVIAICVVLLLTGVISMQRLRTVQNVINVLVGLLCLASLLIVVASVVWLLQGHKAAVDLLAGGHLGLDAGGQTLFGLAAFAFVGVQGASTLRGEVRRSRTINRHLLWGALILFLIYATNTVAVLIVLGPQAANNPFALVTVVDRSLGKMAGNLTAICLMSSFIATILALNTLNSRLVFVNSIDRGIALIFGRLNKQRVPLNACLLQTILAMVVADGFFLLVHFPGLFDQQKYALLGFYVLLRAVAAMIWAVATLFLFINLWVYSIRGRWHFLQSRILPVPLLWLCVLVGLVVCLFAIGYTLFYSWLPQFSDRNWWYTLGSIVFGCLIVAAIASMLANSEVSWKQDIGEG